MVFCGHILGPNLFSGKEQFEQIGSSGRFTGKEHFFAVKFFQGIPGSADDTQHLSMTGDGKIRQEQKFLVMQGIVGSGNGTDLNVSGKNFSIQGSGRPLQAPATAGSIHGPDHNIQERR